MIKALAVSAACLTLSCSVTAGAATHASVSIRLSRDHSKVSGRVDSSKKCESGRNVKLYYAFSTGTTFTKVATTTTSDSGKWSVPGPEGADIPAGRLYAKLPARGKCADAKSKTIEVEGPVSGDHW